MSWQTSSIDVALRCSVRRTMPHSVICRRDRCGKSYKQGSPMPVQEPGRTEKTVPCRNLAGQDGSTEGNSWGGGGGLLRTRRLQLAGVRRTGRVAVAKLVLGLAGEVAHALHGVHHLVVHALEFLLRAFGPAAGGNCGPVETADER